MAHSGTPPADPSLPPAEPSSELPPESSEPPGQPGGGAVVAEGGGVGGYPDRHDGGAHAAAGDAGEDGLARRPRPLERSFSGSSEGKADTSSAGGGGSIGDVVIDAESLESKAYAVDVSDGRSAGGVSKTEPSLHAAEDDQLPPPEATRENGDTHRHGRSAERLEVERLRQLRRDAWGSVRAASDRVRRRRPAALAPAREMGVKECTTALATWCAYCAGGLVVCGLFVAPLVLGIFSAVERSNVSGLENDLQLETWSPSSVIETADTGNGFTDAGVPVGRGFTFTRVCVVVCGALILFSIPFTVAVNGREDDEVTCSVVCVAFLALLTAFISSLVLAFGARSANGANWLRDIRASSEDANSKCVPLAEVPEGVVIRQACAVNPIDFPLETAWTSEEDDIGGRCKGNPVSLVPAASAADFAAGCSCATAFEWPTFKDMNQDHEHQFATTWGSDPASAYCPTGSTKRISEWCAEYRVTTDDDGNDEVTDKCKDTKESLLTFCYTTHALRAAKPCAELDELQQHLDKEAAYYLAFGIVVILIPSLPILLTILYMAYAFFTS